MIVTGTAPVTVESIDKIAVSTPVLGTQMAPSNYPSVTPVITTPVITQNTPIHSTPVQTLPVQPVPVQTTPVIVSQPVTVIMPANQIKLTPEMSIVTGKNYRLQVGSFKNAKNAVEAFDKLKASGLSPAYERFINGDNVEFYRVVVAGVRGSDVQLTAEKISAAGFREAIIKEEN